MTDKMTEKEMMDLSGLSAQELEKACNAQREPREVELEAFAMQRAQEETKKGRSITLIVTEVDHTDGHISNVVYGDLHVASKVCKHLSNDLAMRVIKQLANDMGISVDSEVKA